eukprot:14082074-Alexandrium_andersonii.AAC.1
MGRMWANAPRALRSPREKQQVWLQGRPKQHQARAVLVALAALGQRCRLRGDQELSLIHI